MTPNQETAADRARAFFENHKDIPMLDPHFRVRPNVALLGLMPTRNPIWRIPGLHEFARPIRLVKRKIEERISKRLEYLIAETGLIFVHIPKNAGTSVNAQLYR